MCSAEVMNRSEPALKSMRAALRGVPRQFSAVISGQFQVHDLRRAHLVPCKRDF